MPSYLGNAAVVQVGLENDPPQRPTDFPQMSVFVSHRALLPIKKKNKTHQEKGLKSSS